jgi:hypothetical protein
MTTLANLNVHVNEYDVGVDDTDMSIPYVQTDEGFYQLKESEMVNPFFVSLLDKVDFANPENKKRPKNIYVVCMRENFSKTQNLNILYQQIVDKTAFATACRELTVLKAPYVMLYNNIFKSVVKYIKSEVLSTIFSTQFSNSEELVLVMFELTENVARMNNSLYGNMYGIEDLMQMVQLTSQYNRKYKKQILPKFSSNLANFSNAQFWTSQENGSLINMTDVFKDRGFEYKVKKLELFKKSLENMNKKESDVVKNIFDSNAPKQKNHSSNNNEKVQFDYLHKLNKDDKDDKDNKDNKQEKQEEKQEEKQQEKPTNKFGTVGGTTEFHDIFTAMKHADKRTYYIENDLEVTQDYINEVFDFLSDSEEEMFHVLNMLLVSKDYCHMVLKQPVLNKIKPLMTKYLPLYKYVFGYAWTTHIIDESIMKTRATKKERFMFNIETACQLPYFPICFDDIFQNPYVCIPVNKQLLNTSRNVMSIPGLVNGENYYGVCNIEQFKYRMNLFMTGKPDVFPLKDINWQHFAISGSMMPACLQKKSPLFDLVTEDTQKDEDKWKTFFNHYYDEADIDLICHSNSIFDFLEKAETVIASLDKNLGAGTTKVEHVKNMATFVTKQFFSERVSDFNEKYGTNYTPEEMCKLLEQKGDKEDKEINELHEYLYEIYTMQKFKFNNQIRKQHANNGSKLIKYLMEPSSIKDLNINVATYDTLKQNNNSEDNEMCFYINDFRDKNNQVPENENLMLLKFSENLKFKIINKDMLHSIELFKTNKDDFFGIVGRFHLPCVRAYYQDNNVYLAPSCITAMMTGINIDYKYFAGTRDPVDIINKYRMRGFSTLLSPKELEHFKEYNNNVKTFGGMFHVDNVEQTLGCKDLNDKIFKPKHFKEGLPIDIYKNTSTLYIKTVDDLKKHYSLKYNYKPSSKLDMFNFRVIGDDGSIQPYEGWIVSQLLSSYEK